MSASSPPFNPMSQSVSSSMTQVWDAPGLWLLKPDRHELKPGAGLAIALGLHIAVVGSILLILFLAQLLGWHIPLLDLQKIKPRDLEFVLVDAPNQKPRDPNTRNRAQQNSRSGGKVVKNLPKVQTSLQRGQKSPRPQPKATQTPTKPAPARKPQRPQPRQQPTPRPVTPTPPRQQQPKPQQPKPQPKQESPMSPPKTPTPPKAPPPRLIEPPKIKPRTLPPLALPSPTGESGLPSGPVLTRSGRTSSRPSSNSGGGNPSPSQIPSQVASQPSSSGAPGGSGARSSAGQGGQGNFSQYGSPGGGGGRAGIDAIAEPDFGPYISEVQRRIKRNWTPPSDSQTRKIVVVFTINRSGALQSVRIQRSSGTPVADQAAVQAVQASAPFRPLPPQYRGNSIDIVFTFDYNVLTGGRIG